MHASKRQDRQVDVVHLSDAMIPSGSFITLAEAKDFNRPAGVHISS